MTFALGVDLGTSHTVAMLRWTDGRTRPLLFDGQPLLPSAVFLDRGGRLHVGRDAERLGHAEPDRFEPNPKRHVDADSVLLGGSAVPVADLFAALLGAVAREAVAAAGFLPPAVLTHPAAWGDRRRQMLVAALAQAGWPRETALVPEPVAAARYFAEVLRRPVPVGSSLAVFDFGAGTLDVAVVRNEGGGRFTVVASGGLDKLGGLDLDAAVVDHLEKSVAGAEPQAWAALADPGSLAQWRARRQFWEDVRGVKEMLSRATSAPVPVPGVEHAVELTRDELEAAIDPLIRRGVTEAGVVVKAAGLAPTELAGLFLVGGSSRVPMVARLLHGELGIAPTVLEQPELPVAEGAIISVTAARGPTTVPAHAEPRHDQAAQPRPDQAAQPHRDQAVRYEPGLVTAATPTPTPTTAPSSPISPAPHYPEPVDPWATAEAQAFDPPPPPAEAWLASSEPGTAAATPPQPAEPGRRTYRKWVWVSAFAGGVVLVAALLVVFWPGYRAIDFQPLADPIRVAPAVPVGVEFSDAEVIGDRTYFASVDGKRLGVVAARLTDGKRLWSSTEAGSAERWLSMVPLPDAVAVFTDTDTTSRKRRLIVLGADDGKKRWERTIDGEDSVYFVGSLAVLVDRTEKRLLGLKIDNGKIEWEQPNLKTDSGTATRILPVTTSDDISGPGSGQGRAFAPDLDDDTRIVQISADRSARVIDASTGKIQVKPRQSVADTNDEAIAFNSRLIVHESANDRIVSYDLDKLGEPKVLYTAADTGRQFEHLVPCGKDRVCFVETAGYDRKSARVVSVDAAKGRQWSRAVADTDGLLPVGESVLALQDTTPDKMSLLDAKGKISWARDGTGGRLDGGNLLLFSKALSTSPSDPALTGEHLGDKPVPLGSLSDVRSATCSWNKAFLACVADKDFVLVKFAG